MIRILSVPIDQDNVWLNRQQMAELFERDIKTIGKHINNALKEELDESVVANFATTATDGKTYQVAYYNLDMIISVGYRVKSPRGVEFRRWANSVLKEYIMKGYAVNDNRITQLGKVIQIMRRTENSLDAKQVLSVIEKYNRALDIKSTYVLAYDECRALIGEMKYGNESSVFGNEKDESFKGSIAAAIFLYFLDKNNALFIDGEKAIADHTLVALTIMIAESKPSEKEMMISVIMNCIA